MNPLQQGEEIIPASRVVRGFVDLPHNLSNESRLEFIHSDPGSLLRTRLVQTPLQEYYAIPRANATPSARVGASAENVNGAGDPLGTAFIGPGCGGSFSI